MLNNSIKTPIALIFFKRPEETRTVFNQIKKVKPQKLFLISDGPRNNEDAEKCAETRKIMENIDWNCTVIKNYSEINLGCRNRVVSGLNWLFGQVDEAIILEDDCVPDETFFYYCEELLEKYRDNHKIIQIAGVNFQQKNPLFKCHDSYYFSKLPQTWGWATWKRAWKLYDSEMEDWPKIKQDKILKNTFTDPIVLDYWEYLFSNMHQTIKSETYVWDTQWALSCFKNNGLSINPCVNLVTNIGSTQDATGTKNGKGQELMHIPRNKILLPLKHPTQINVYTPDFF